MTMETRKQNRKVGVVCWRKVENSTLQLHSLSTASIRKCTASIRDPTASFFKLTAAFQYQSAP